MGMVHVCLKRVIFSYIQRNVFKVQHICSISTHALGSAFKSRLISCFPLVLACTADNVAVAAVDDEGLFHAYFGFLASPLKQPPPRPKPGYLSTLRPSEHPALLSPRFGLATFAHSFQFQRRLELVRLGWLTG